MLQQEEVAVEKYWSVGKYSKSLFRRVKKQPKWKKKLSYNSDNVKVGSDELHIAEK